MIYERLPMNACLRRGMNRSLMLVLAGAVFAASQAPAAETLDNLDADAVAIFRQLPGVVQVTRHGPPGRPSHRVVHLLDWHFVPKDRYAADLRSLSDKLLSDAEVEGHWKELLREVAVVQTEQLVVLRQLIQRLGLRSIHVEGLTSRDMPIFEAKVAVLRKVGAELASLRSIVEELGEEDAGQLVKQLEGVEQQQHRDLLQLGAAGRLLMEGTIKAVVPLEEVASYEAADPVAEDGTVVLNQDRIEARQDAQVKRLLDGGKCSLIILGGAHDLSDNLDRFSGGQTEYIRVATKRWQEIAGDIGEE